MTKLRKWYRRRRFMKAYHILEKEAAFHTRAGHHMQFVAVNEANLAMRCSACPDLQPVRVGTGRRSWGI